MNFRRNGFVRSFTALVAAICLTTLPLAAGITGELPVDRASTVAGGSENEERTGVSFEQNLGQFDERVGFLARSGRSSVFLTANEAVYVLPDESGESKETRAFALRMRLAGANETRFRGRDRAEQISSYFRGDSQKPVTAAPHYTSVASEEVYDGIGMVWYGLDEGAVRYDFEVAPMADPAQIALEFEGSDSIEIDAAGDLLIHTKAGTIRQKKPVSFQSVDGKLREVESSFEINGARVGFRLGEYDRSQPLTIDPTVQINNLAFSTMLGSFGDEHANDITVDANGCAYVTGRTTSATFPTTAGTFDPTANGSEDVFVTKFNAGGTGIVFSTYLGGPFYDEGHGIAVDASGNVFVAGIASIAFPTTSGAFDETFNGGSDVFVSKLNATGSALIYSTYVGASQTDTASDLAIDGSGNAYVSVRTSDAVVDFPTTPGAFDTTFNGFDDAAVFKLNPAGSALVYSTFLGGSHIDAATSIAVNQSGEVYVTGSTTDDVIDFPVTAGSYDTTHNGVTDFFVTRISADGSSLVYSTFIGGPGIDNANAIAIDGAGNAYVGGTVSPGFPTTAGVVDTTSAGGGEAGIAKLNAAGTALVYSTFIGGTQSENLRGIAVDPFGRAHLSMDNFGGDFPVTVDAYDSTFNGSNDACLVVLNAAATAYAYSTYFGGNGSEFGNDIALDTAGNAYIAGSTVNSTTPFPTLPTSYQPVHAGGTDAYVFKFGDFSIGGRVVDTSGNPLQNVVVALSGQVSGIVITGADGRFGFLETVPGEPHVVTATRAGYSINPAIFNIAGLASNRELVFVGAVGSPTGGSGGTLAFENISYNKAENAGSVTVTVKRTGTITEANPVTVDFATSNGTATAGQDFVQKTGVLTFNAFETSKTITIDLVNDQILEPREGFFLTLSNPTNNADIETGGGTSEIKILDEDLADGSLLISEFRQRGRLGANDEFVKLFNPNEFDVTVQSFDGSDGVTLARVAGDTITPVATIPNLITIRARGHYLLTNNSPDGGFSLIDYPTGSGTTTAVGDQTFSADIPDNADLVLFRTSQAGEFTISNKLDAVGFGSSSWAEGEPLPAMFAVDSEMSFVRRLNSGGLQDLGSNSRDFLLVENRARSFSDENGFRLYSTLGAPAPETSESLRLMTLSEIPIEPFGTETYDSSPVPNGVAGTLTIYRRISNLTTSPLTAVRLRVIDFPTAGSASQKRFSSRPDFRLLNSSDEGGVAKGLSLAADRLQPNGGGINSTLTIDSITSAAPLAPGQSVIVAIRLGIMRYGRHPLTFAVEAQ